MSNPYGGFPQYEPPAGGPYTSSGNPYGNPYSASTPTDGISIAALICSLTCCAAPVGIGLGIAGIVRTKDEQRSGRWAAIAGIVLGVFMMLAAVGVGVGLTWYGTNTVFIEDARAGDCIDVGDDDFDIWKAECDEPHDAEVIHAQEFDEDLVDQYLHTDVFEFCARLTDGSGYPDDVRRGSYELDVWVDSWDVEEPEPGDHLICVAQPSSGEKLDAPLPRDERPQQTGAETPLYDLHTGDCFDEPDSMAEDDLIGFVRVLPCDEGHQFELYAVVVVAAPDPAYPGDTAIEARADECLSRFAMYLDIPYDDSRYESSYYSPTEESWGRGDRTIFCMVADPDDARLTESLKGVAR